MKVGLVTLYRGYNYGTSLQAYALKRFISSLGWRTEILWLAEGADKGRDIRLAKIAKIAWRCLWHPQLLRHTFLSYKNSFSKPIPSEIREKFLTFAHTKLQVKGLPAAQLKKFAQDDDTLALVCGSDQIWSAAAANIDPLYFLRFAPEHKRVAYAPSFGGKTVPEYNRKILASYIREIPFVSVREDSGADIVKNLTDKDAPVLPDPSLLLDWEEFAGPAPFDNYIAAYFLDTPSQAALQSLQRISAKHGCQIIAFPYRHAAYERLPRITYYPAGPQDFVRLIKGAKCVLTDSFHGTVFSINLQTPFWTFQRNYASGKGQSERLLSLLGKIHLQSRYITSPDIKTQDIPSDAQTQTAAKEWVISQRSAARDFLQNAFRRIGEKMSNNAEKISVIVPCYNVGAYVEKCLLSILNQHYTNIEVWAVDDGSADGTPAVLDRLARQYPQLKVIHQKNAGVSAARNTGLAHAQGDYVVFVDGDDYLAPDYMDYMLELIHKTGADFALSTQWFRKKTDKQTPRPSMQTVSPAQAVALLLSPNVVVGCWNKIYKRSLLTRHQCRFNTELFYGEGLNFIITVAQLAGKIAVGNRKVYYYRRNNAASATTRFNIHTLQSNTQSLDLIEQNLKVRTNDIDVMLTLHRSLFYLSTAVRIQTAGKTRTYQTEYKKCMAYVRKHFFKLLFKRQVSLYRKAMLAAGCLCPRLLAKMDVIRRKRIAAQSVGE